ncbi:hypothetical protein CR513_51942, partial [Mucuna pruriens]
MVHKAENNKLTPKWEGPFRVRKEVGRGAYSLETLKGKEIPRTWNASSLRMIQCANSTKLTIDSPQISPVSATYTVGHGFASDKSKDGNSTKLTMDSPRISPKMETQ